MDTMKRRNRIIALMLVLAFALTFFAGCGGKPVKLPPPTNLQINGTTLTWDEVESASGYVIDIGGNEETTTENTYNLSALTEPGNYSIAVMALGDGEKYLDSDWSQVKEYVVEPPIEQSLEFKKFPQRPTCVVAGIGTITSNEIVVPAAFDGIRVTEIGLNAFENNINLTSVTLPDTILHINAFAFAGCTALETIDLPYGLITIQKSAFSGSGLKALNMPDSVTSTFYSIIDNCLNLESIRFSESLTTLAPKYFENTPKLKSVVLPDSLCWIGPSAFVGSSIESIKIPQNVKGIRNGAFQNTVIKSIEFANDSVLNAIERFAFRGCKNLESIILPDNLTTIEEWAFSDCSNLKSIVIPNSVTEMGYATFRKCNSLKSVTIPDGITTIENQTFEDCRNLTSVVLGSGVASIGAWAFINCENLKDVYYTGSEEDWKKISIGVKNENLTNATIHYNYKPENE